MTAFGERSTAETGVYIPNIFDFAQRAKDAYMGAFLDWNVVEWQKYPDKAFDYYVSHLHSMHANQNWPEGLVYDLRENALEILAQVTTADDFWNMIRNSENQIIVSNGYRTADLRNFQNHKDFLVSVSSAAGSYRDVLEEFAPHNIVKDSTMDSMEDLKKILIGCAVVYVGVQIIK